MAGVIHDVCDPINLTTQAASLDVYRTLGEATQLGQLGSMLLRSQDSRRLCGFRPLGRPAQPLNNNVRLAPVDFAASDYYVLPM